MLHIRPAASGDMPAIAALYAHYVLHDTCTFETVPPTADDMAARHAEVVARGLPYLVAEHEGRVVGYASCNWFKPRPAYRFSAENSIYLAHGTGGRGWGGQLLGALAEAAEAVGVRQLIAVIGGSEHAASISLHRSQGFVDAGVLKACGWKQGRWLDVVLMQKTLGAGGSTPADDGAP